MYNENYLIHYGIIGMRWGQRRLQNRIANARSRGNKEKVKKLQKRFDENQEIRKMKISDKIFLSRQGVLANKRLIDKGQSKVSRLLELHGVNAISTSLGSAVTNAATTPFQRGIMNGEHMVGNSLAKIGTMVIGSIATATARDYVYKQIN